LKVRAIPGLRSETWGTLFHSRQTWATRLRSKGEGHLTRINDILTNLMEAERRAGSGR
jgi:hypothetical protein